VKQIALAPTYIKFGSPFDSAAGDRKCNRSRNWTQGCDRCGQFGPSRNTIDENDPAIEVEGAGLWTPWQTQDA